MGYFSKLVGVCAAVTLLSVAVVGAEEKDPLKPRVAPDQMADAKAMKNPVASTPESIAKGKALYEGKGTCFNCHGKEGKGDGPAGAILNPSPRNFTNCKFHKKRKDGELFWVIKNGSAGTGMVSLIPAAINEEEAWMIINYERSFCKGGEEKSNVSADRLNQWGASRVSSTPPFFYVGSARLRIRVGSGRGGTAPLPPGCSYCM